GVLPVAHDRQLAHGLRPDGHLHRRRGRLPRAGGTPVGTRSRPRRRAAGAVHERVRALPLPAVLDLRHGGTPLAARDRCGRERRSQRGPVAGHVLPPAGVVATCHPIVLRGRAGRGRRTGSGDRLGCRRRGHQGAARRVDAAGTASGRRAGALPRRRGRAPFRRRPRIARQRTRAGGSGAHATPRRPGPCEAVGVTFDCRSCGACCCNTDENRAENYFDYVEVTPRAALSRHPVLLRRLTVLNRDGERHMKLRGREQRCVALEGVLGVEVSCAIYQLRPAGCRRVEPGSRECRGDRRGPEYEGHDQLRQDACRNRSARALALLCGVHRLSCRQRHADAGWKAARDLAGKLRRHSGEDGPPVYLWTRSGLPAAHPPRRSHRLQFHHVVYSPCAKGRRMKPLALLLACAACASAPRQAAPSERPDQLAARIVDSPDRSEADRTLDPGRHPKEMLRFLGVRNGMKVLDLGGGPGYTTELIARAAAPGWVGYMQSDPRWLPFLKDSLAERFTHPAMQDVVRADVPFDDPVPPDARDLDLAVMNVIYHDVVNMPVDRARMNKAIFDARSEE